MSQQVYGFLVIIILILTYIAFEVPENHSDIFVIYHPYPGRLGQTDPNLANPKTIAHSIGESNCTTSFPVDVVYTWVNGSDPAFVNSLKHTDLGMKSNKDDTKAQRFADFNQLMYSLRSVEMYAPWIRKIWIVTNGQKPNWVDLNNPNINIVSHDQIFTNKKHLPTFNSRSIESHMHQIPGIR